MRRFKIATAPDLDLDPDADLDLDPDADLDLDLDADHDRDHDRAPTPTATATASTTRANLRGPVTPRPTPPPVFALTIVPFAAAVGWISIAAPYWLARDGVSLADVGVVSGTAMAPHALKVLWAPLLDLGGRRRAWFVGMTLAAAASLVALALLPDPAHHLGAFTLLATVNQVCATTSCAAADGLMAITTAPGAKGRAAGWRMAGNVGGTGLLGAAALWLASRTSVVGSASALGALVAASALAALLIHEPREPRPPGVRLASAVAASLRAIGRDLWDLVRSRQGWTALVICVVPVGAGALTNLFSAMAVEYRAGEGLVAAVNGLWGGFTGAAGSFAGGWLADRMNRRAAYAISGALLAGCAVAMMLAPTTPLTYTWGVLAYNFATGVAFAALAALILEIVGHSVAAATKYTLFIAVANLAGSYVTVLDGWASELRGLGARGSLGADALLTVLGIGVLAVLALATRSGREASAAATR